MNNLSQKTRDSIVRIILFGSVARNEATKDSDVDIFIELKKKSKPIEKEIEKKKEEFYLSRETLLFKAKNINPKISIKIGLLKEWKDLYAIIASTGIVLYGHYEAQELPSGVKHYLLVYWDSIAKNRGAFLNRIYGFKVHDKQYSGLLTNFDGRKLGKSNILIPIEHKQEILPLLLKYGVKAKIMEVFV
ncbi:nucleotidyltransferase domain-containing protein [Candidatus Woesearchaeota archaeon]|nr:nucleotidyltransferase domain-containing protein [Candidatus Woesearchaeota archaeon]